MESFLYPCQLMNRSDLLLTWLRLMAWVKVLKKDRRVSIEPSRSEIQAKDARGTSQLGLRLYNERLVLSLIRRHGALSKIELARLTGLSAQTVSVIVRALDSTGLVVPGEPQRGRVGQPMVPYTLQPGGAGTSL